MRSNNKVLMWKSLEKMLWKDFDKEKVIPCNALHKYYEELIKCNG